jgi:hypothetical protein
LAHNRRDFPIHGPRHAPPSPRAASNLAGARDIKKKHAQREVNVRGICEVDFVFVRSDEDDLVLELFVRKEFIDAAKQ